MPRTKEYTNGYSSDKSIFEHRTENLKSELVVLLEIVESDQGRDLLLPP